MSDKGMERRAGQGAEQKTSGKRAAHFGSLQAEALSTCGMFSRKHEPTFIMNGRTAWLESNL